MEDATPTPNTPCRGDHAPLRSTTTTHLVKSEDLNHHQTLYAGRCVEWCVQTAYIAAENLFDDPQPLVFMSLRNLCVREPARIGEILEFTGAVDYLGESTIGVRIEARKLQPRSDQKLVASGAFLFCTINEKGKSVPHRLAESAPARASAAANWRRMEQEAPLPE